MRDKLMNLRNITVVYNNELKKKLNKIQINKIVDKKGIIINI